MANDRRESQEHCAITNPMEYAGTLFLIFGFLVSGVLLIVTGNFFHDDSLDFEAIEITYAIAAGFIILAMIGYYMNMPNILCSSSERGLHYFGNMFILIGFIGVSGFMLGAALQFGGSGLDTDKTQVVEDFSYLTGVFLLLFAVGWLICHAMTNMSCVGDQVFAHTVGHYLVVIFIIVAGGLYFGLGAMVHDSKMTETANLMIVIGVCYIIVSIGLLCVNCL